MINYNMNIFPNSWLQLHTYSVQNIVDKSYLVFANRVYTLLQNDFPMIPASFRQVVALAITSYIEDKQSHLNLFTSFVDMIRRETKTCHPLDAYFGDVIPAEFIEQYMIYYDDDVINIIDLAFLLASNSMEDENNAKQNLIDAERLLTNLRDMDYEQLPSNDEYFDSLCDLIELDGWQGLLTFLLWLTNKSYFLAPLINMLIDDNQVQTTAKMYGISHASAIPAARLHLLFDDKFYQAGLRPATFAEAFARKSELDADTITQLSELEVARFSLFEILESNAEELMLKGLDGILYPISIDDKAYSHYTVGHNLSCQLVKYEDKWHILTSPRVFHRSLTSDEYEKFIRHYDKNGY
jgi:hypothetical protein